MKGFGAFTGWILFALSIVMASAEGVMALGAGGYDGIATADIWTLLAGSTPQSGVSAALMHLPAWTVTGTLGLMLILACRKKRKISNYVHMKR